MAIAHYHAGGTITSTDSGLSDGGTITLTGASSGRAQAISSVIIRALGTITVSDILISKNDGTTQLARVGATSALPNGGVFTFTPPVNGAPNDNAKVTATLTGATAASVCITANYEIVNA